MYFGQSSTIFLTFSLLKVGLFSHFRDHTVPEPKLVCSHIKKVWMTNVEKTVLLIIAASFLLFIITVPDQAFYRHSIQPQVTIGGA
ncbi:hypothetical protein [Paenibacillus polymyxa]|uniref:hypothetical protein n=1 Tax=Paenibacillus polymyxa TaxID=1406 RepID=UPI0007EAD387|nr:hypothetical protein [Paenibacillus polymyxa]OAZ39193.1 hypothetical protein A9Z39_25120 [Paenibacillus polymyxa]